MKWPILRALLDEANETLRAIRIKSCAHAAGRERRSNQADAARHDTRVEQVVGPDRAI
jgi:hypothetical protein